MVTWSLLPFAVNAMLNLLNDKVQITGDPAMICLRGRRDLAPFSQEIHKLSSKTL